jgi:hypothetical protein
MVTAGDVEFEPPHKKIFSLTSSIAVMVAGDTAIQSEILMKVQEIVNIRIQSEPSNWWRVSDVAELYRRCYNEVRALKSEQKLLAPLGLTHDTFIARQQELLPALVTQLATELINFDMPGTQTIFAGVDETGTHLYVANGGDIVCHDAVGFAAIGSGYWHADSQLMFAGHGRGSSLAETLLLVYSSKRRAEVAPGVGEATDMFFVGPQIGSLSNLGDHVRGKLEEIYQATQDGIAAVNLRAKKGIHQYVKEINDAAAAAAAVDTQKSPERIVDPKEATDGD